MEVEEEEIEEDAPLLKAEKMPSFQGGDLNKFRNWVQSKLKYPKIAQENGISGRVTLAFVIEKDGTLTGIQVMQSPDKSLSEEAIRVVSSSPKWSPGMQRNQPVRVRYQLPVNFQLRN
jgi:protein TonB